MNMELDELDKGYEICPTRIIEDRPVEDDSIFSNKSGISPHSRIAQTLAEIIKSPNETGGKMIGLEGGWGAGKTTVINMLRKLLSNDKKITLISFDAWAHEGDPLRRTYLESLIRHFILLDGWIDNKKWNEKLNKLSKRSRTTTTSTKRQTTLFGRIFATAIFLVPIGVPFLRESLNYTIFSINTDLNVSWMFLFGFLMSAMPITVLFLNFVRVAFKKEKEPEDWAFLKGDSIDESTQDTTETPEPTSIEFEDIFNELMREAINSSSERKIIIVIDNLDRVDAQDATTIWSTLQVFLQERCHQEEEWFDSLWMIVPYDPKGLRRLWDGRQSESENTKNFTSDSFIDKSFVIRFEVPPLVLSDWKEYLSALLNKAFPEHNKEDWHAIYRVYSEYVSRRNFNAPPTPRELITFVNYIGGYHRQWQHEFPLDHIAYYVLLIRNNIDVRLGLLEKKVPDAEMLLILSAGVIKSLAGLTFNVKKEYGEQLLLDEPIYSSLSGNHPEALINIKENHGDAFWPNFENAIVSKLTASSASVIAKASMCLEESGLLVGNSRKEIESIKKHLGRVLRDEMNWSPLTSSLAEGIVSSINLLSDDDVTNKIVANVNASLVVQSLNPINSTERKSQLMGLMKIVDALSLTSQDEEYLSPFILNVSQSIWGELCTVIDDLDINCSKYFSVDLDFENVYSQMINQITSGSFDDSQLCTFKISLDCSKEFDFEKMVSAIGARFPSVSAANIYEISPLIDAFYLLKDICNQSVETILKQLADNGSFLNALFISKNGNDKYTEVKCIVMHLLYRPDALLTSNIGQSQRGMQLLNTYLGSSDAELSEKIVNQLDKFDSLPHLFNIADSRVEYDQLIISCFRYVADSDLSASLYNAELVLVNWRHVKALLDDESSGRYKNVIKALCEKDLIIAEIIGREESISFVDTAEFFKDVINFCKPKILVNWCASKMPTYGDDVWRKQFNEEEELLQLMILLRQLDAGVELDSKYTDALIAYSESVLNGSSDPSDYLISNRDALFSVLDDDRHLLVKTRILNLAMDSKEYISDVFFDLFGEEINNEKTIIDEKNIVWKLFTPIIENDQRKGIEWLISVFKKNNKIYSKLKKKVGAKEFKEKIIKSILVGEEESGENYDLLEEISKLNKFSK